MALLGHMVSAYVKRIDTMDGVWVTRLVLDHRPVLQRALPRSMITRVHGHEMRYLQISSQIVRIGWGSMPYWKIGCGNVGLCRRIYQV